jgi:hypothetical protein
MSLNASRRRFLKNALLPGCLSLLGGFSGCLQTLDGDEDELSEGDGVTIAKRVESAPPSTTVVDYNDGRILDHEEFQKPIKQAAETESARFSIKRRHVGGTQVILSRLPKYSAEQSSEFDSGYYFKYEDEIVVLKLLILTEYERPQ